MRCHICDKLLADPQLNSDHGDIDPCAECLDVVQDVLDGYKDKPSAAEDDLPGDDMHFLLDNLPHT
jgi:hypothetical protein